MLAELEVLNEAGPTAARLSRFAILDRERLSRIRGLRLAGVGGLALAGILEWPVAAAVGAGHILVHNRNSKTLRGFGDALEEA